MTMWEGAIPAHVARFFEELKVAAGCARRKLEREIYARNARKGKGK